jgi:hypothetical protein
MWPSRLTDWISDGITLDITEAELMADLDAWFLSTADWSFASAEEVAA